MTFVENVRKASGLKTEVLQGTVGSNPTSSDTYDDLTLLPAYQKFHVVL